MKSFYVAVTLILISVLPVYAGKWSTGTTAPATCTVGDSWTDTNGTADNRFYTCTATNTWTLNSNQTAIDAKADKNKTIRDWSDHPDDGTTIAAGTPIWYGGKLYNTAQAFNKVSTSATPDILTVYFEVVTGSGGGIAHATSDGNYHASKDGAWASLDGVFLTPAGSAANLTSFPSSLATDAEVTTAVSGKANSTAFASAVAFEAAFGWAPGSGSISLSTEQDWTAVQNFDGGLTASGITITLGSLSDIKFGTDNWLDDTKGNGDNNYLWSADKIFDQLALKSDTTHNHTGTYEPADSNIIKVSEIDSLAEFTALLGWSPGSGGSFSFDTFPTYEDSAHTSGIAVNGTTLAVYSITASKWLTVGLTDSLDPTPVTHSLTITPASFTGADKFTYDSTDYTTEQVITGLSADASFTVTPDTGRAITCAGTGLTDNTGGSYTANTDTANVAATCTSSAATSYTFNSTMDSLSSITSPLAGTGGTTTGDETYTTGVTDTAFTKNAATTSGFSIPSSNLSTSGFTMEFDFIPSHGSGDDNWFVNTPNIFDLRQGFETTCGLTLDNGGSTDGRISWEFRVIDSASVPVSAKTASSTTFGFAAGEAVRVKVSFNADTGDISLYLRDVLVASRTGAAIPMSASWLSGSAPNLSFFKTKTHTSKIDNLKVW